MYCHIFFFQIIVIPVIGIKIMQFTFVDRNTKRSAVFSDHQIKTILFTGKLARNGIVVLHGDDPFLPFGSVICVVMVDPVGEDGVLTV